MQCLWLVINIKMIPAIATTTELVLITGKRRSKPGVKTATSVGVILQAEKEASV
jgi:hypothetical protein